MKRWKMIHTKEELDKKAKHDDTANRDALDLNKATRDANNTSDDSIATGQM